MITQRQIEDAAKDYEGFLDAPGESNPDFVAGANWAIEQINNPYYSNRRYTDALEFLKGKLSPEISGDSSMSTDLIAKALKIAAGIEQQPENTAQ